jgi:hypothetical protein
VVDLIIVGSCFFIVISCADTETEKIRAAKTVKSVDLVFI